MLAFHICVSADGQQQSAGWAVWWPAASSHATSLDQRPPTRLLRPRTPRLFNLSGCKGAFAMQRAVSYTDKEVTRPLRRVANRRVPLRIT